MSDHAIHTWLQSHQLLLLVVGLVGLGSTGSVFATMATQSEAETKAWRARHPALAFVGDGLRAAGIDLPKLVTLFATGFGLLINLLSKEKEE